MAITGVLGKLLIELAANTARLQSDMGKAVGIAEKAAAKIKTAFKFAGGGLLGAALANTVKQSIQFGDEIAKAATKAGIGGKAMSELAFAAKMADVDVASLSTALKKMQVSLSEAGSGSKGPIQALSALGLTIQDMQRRRPDQQFELLGQRISQLKDPADRARAATELFGKAGSDLLPLFEQGAQGIAKARAEAVKLGLSFSEDQLQKLSAADDSIKRLSASWQGFATTLTAKVAPALAHVLDLLSGHDTRSTDDKIRSLEQIVRLNEFSPAAAGSPEDIRRREAAEELKRLRGRQELERLRDAQTGTAGGPLGRREFGSSIGFAAVTAAEAAAEAAEKARKEAAKAREKALAEEEKARQQAAERILDRNERAIDREIDYEMERRRDVFESQIKHQNELDEARARIAKRQQESIQIFKDAFMQAWDDMVHNGKIKWDELLKFMVAQFARMQIGKLIDRIGGAGTAAQATGGSGAGFWGLLGFAKGGRPPLGRPSIVGEQGPELFMPDQAGTIVPNGMFGSGSGGVRLSIVNNIDARGASVELIQRLPRILEANNQRVKAEFADELRRNRYRLQ